MAQVQFNEWEPKLDAVNGRQAQEPRVFAHDAVAIVVGAINNSDANHGIRVTNAGAGYAVGNTITLTTTGGATTPAVVTVDEVDGTGAVTKYRVTTPGVGYSINDTESDAGVGVFACTITNIDIPHTQKRGCCVYIGKTGGLASLTVIMESGNTATFTNISEGTILPILIQRVTTAITGNEVIALY
tara:strand:- start:583 stop:1140 length:558 start_codon:yes stop_codon:yes gene_type:complete